MSELTALVEKFTHTPPGTVTTLAEDFAGALAPGAAKILPVLNFLKEAVPAATTSTTPALGSAFTNSVAAAIGTRIAADPEAQAAWEALTGETSAEAQAAIDADTTAILENGAKWVEAELTNYSLARAASVPPPSEPAPDSIPNA